MPKRTQQVAALPWRQGENGLEILLVTTRTSKRWLIPKGWTMDGKADHEAAAIEAYEEAGLRGEADPTPIGTYGYVKVLSETKTRFLNVRVYALQVHEVLESWPEQSERERCWVSKQQALVMIGEPELLPVVAAFGGKVQKLDAAPIERAGLFERIRKWWRDFLR